VQVRIVNAGVPGETVEDNLRRLKDQVLSPLGTKAWYLHSNTEGKLFFRDVQNLVAKLNQIVEQAQLTLQDPQSLIAERQKMIIALARFVCAEMKQPSPTPPEA
jgi:hypothetical protein